jgi:hypothetical protein
VAQSIGPEFKQKISTINYRNHSKRKENIVFTLLFNVNNENSPFYISNCNKYKEDSKMVARGRKQKACHLK